MEVYQLPNASAVQEMMAAWKLMWKRESEEIPAAGN
jgi:hypothetical protein